MKALITGITGQDGSYLAEFLLSRGYDVHGTVRRTSGDRLDRVDHIVHRIHLHYADLLDQLALVRLIEKVQPDEVYNLAAQAFASSGWDQPELTCQLNGLGIVRLLEAVRLIDPRVRIFQASSAEMFGRPAEYPQTEQTPLLPTTPCGAAKLYAHLMAGGYRQKYGLKVCCGILFDHESPRRSLEYITRRITHAAACVKLGLQDKVTLESIDLCCDWGFAGDYVRAFWMMLQHPTADDYIVATGQAHTLEEFCEAAFEAADLDWRDHVVVERTGGPQNDLVPFTGDACRAQRKLLWEPEVSFEEMIKMMVEADLARHSLKNRVPSEVANREQWQRSIS